MKRRRVAIAAGLVLTGCTAEAPEPEPTGTASGEREQTQPSPPASPSATTPVVPAGTVAATGTLVSVLRSSAGEVRITVRPGGDHLVELLDFTTDRPAEPEVSLWPEPPGGEVDCSDNLTGTNVPTEEPSTDGALRWQWYFGSFAYGNPDLGGAKDHPNLRPGSTQALRAPARAEPRALGAVRTHPLDRQRQPQAEDGARAVREHVEQAGGAARQQQILHGLDEHRGGEAEWGGDPAAARQRGEQRRRGHEEQDVGGELDARIRDRREPAVHPLDERHQLVVDVLRPEHDHEQADGAHAEGREGDPATLARGGRQGRIPAIQRADAGTAENGGMYAFIRHGQTDWNLNDKLQGASDIPLNGAGRQQAVEASEALAGGPWTAIVSSPLSRARESATIIAERLSLELGPAYPELVERDYGPFEGEPSSANMAAYPKRDYPGAEPLAAVVARGRAGLARVAADYPDADVLIVCHGTLIRYTLAELAGRSVPGILNGSVSTFSLDGDVWTVETVNGEPLVEAVAAEGHERGIAG